MKFKNIKIYGLEESIIKSGMPHQIGEPIDINLDALEHDYTGNMWNKDKLRATKLANTPIGSGHNNFLKGIIVQFDMSYPQYFTPQLQRYHWIDIVSSQSKMHSLTKIEDIKDSCNKYVLDSQIRVVNLIIQHYNREDLIFPSSLYFPEFEIKLRSKEELFQYIISNLPMGFELWMGISTNYLQLKTIYNQRKSHRLYEWKEFCEFIKELPMSNLITE